MFVRERVDGHMTINIDILKKIKTPVTVSSQFYDLEVDDLKTNEIKLNVYEQLYYNVL